MIHPFLRVVATRPQLLFDHAEAYAELVGEEMGKTAAAWKRRFVLLALAAFFAVAALGFGGVALMLWAVSPASQIHAAWVLIATPVVPALIALVCVLAARGDDTEPFAEFRRQVASDLAMVREVSAA